MIGKRFDKLLVIALIDCGWYCQCDCGKTITASTTDLKRKRTRSCGCLRRKPIQIGAQFGLLTVVAEAAPVYTDRLRNGKIFKKTHYRYLCRCICGQEVLSKQADLNAGDTLSCGVCGKTGELNHNFKHGHTSGRRGEGKRTPEYRCWRAIINRCYNPKYHQYHNYGGRGIRVCERWLNSFTDFLADMGSKPTLKHSIERRETNGDYTKDNCYWATDSEQRANRRSSTKITINGVTKSLFQWRQELGVKPATYTWRRRHGWTELESLLGRT